MLLTPSPRSESGGSPLEKLATTEPLEIAFPQLSLSCTINVAGHPAGTAKFPARPDCVRASCDGLQTAVVSACTAAELEAACNTTRVTPTVRSALLISMLTVP